MSTGKAIGGSVLALVFFVIAEVCSAIIGEVLFKAGLNAAVCNAIAGIIFVVSAFFLFKGLTKILKISMEDVGITKIRLSLKWVFIAILLPVSVLGVFLLLPGDFVLSDMSRSEMASRLASGIFFSGLGSGFVEEMEHGCCRHGSLPPLRYCTHHRNRIFSPQQPSGNNCGNTGGSHVLPYLPRGKEHLELRYRPLFLEHHNHRRCSLRRK